MPAERKVRPKVLVLGATGMAGHVFLREWLASALVDVFGTVRSESIRGTGLPSALVDRLLFRVDALEFDSIRTALDAVAPDVVVNCIGVIKQAREARDPAHCIQLNSLLPHLLASECKSRNIRLVLISTDCVFSGSRGGYRETDVPDPIDLYGRSKLLGEIPDGDPLTLRTSMIGHELDSNRSLLDWFLSQQDSVRGYRRAIFSGLTTIELARFIGTVAISNPSLKGLFHVAAQPISKYELLQLVASEYGWVGELVPTDDVVCDRSLSALALSEATGYRPPTWPEMISEMREHDEESGMRA